MLCMVHQLIVAKSPHSPLKATPKKYNCFLNPVAHVVVISQSMDVGIFLDKGRPPSRAGLEPPFLQSLVITSLAWAVNVLTVLPFEKFWGQGHRIFHAHHYMAHCHQHNEVSHVSVRSLRLAPDSWGLDLV